MSEKLKVPASGADERASKRRLRSIKRDTTPAKEGRPVHRATGQKKFTKRAYTGPTPRV